MKLLSILPLSQQTKNYKLSIFRADLIAGLTVGVMLVPQGMAYAYLAGVPPIYGLYAGLIPLVLYALLGTSRQMSVGPVAVSAILVAGGLSQIALPESIEYISLAITLSLLIGIIQLSLGLLKMGFFANFLSHPVIAGFTSAAAIIIGVSQLKDAFGIEIPRSHNILGTLTGILENITNYNHYALLIFVGSVVFISLLKRINKKLPGAFLSVMISTAIVHYFNLEAHGVNILGAIPSGLPQFSVPELSITQIGLLIPTVITVSIIGIVESIGIAKILEKKHGNYSIDIDQELIALGTSKLFGSFFQSIPTSGSFSRSAVNSESGAQTTVSSLITSIVVALALIALTSLFYSLPMAVLAAIIMLSVKSLFNYKEAIHLWKTYRSDFYLMLITFITTLAIGIEMGVLFGVILSLLIVLYKATRPHITVLGNIQGTDHYRNVNRFKNAEAEKDILIVRLDNQLFFGNCEYFKKKVFDFIKDNQDPIKHVIIDAGNIHDVDSCGMHVLEELDTELELKGINLHLSDVIGPVRDNLYKFGLLKDISRHHMSVKEAIDVIKEIKKKDPNNRAMQTDIA